MPEGFGHVYTTQAHIEAWAAVLQPEGWSAADTAAFSSISSTDDEEEQLVADPRCCR